MEGVQELKPQQSNQGTDLSINGHVSPPLWYGDLVSNPAWHQENEDIPWDVSMTFWEWLCAICTTMLTYWRRLRCYQLEQLWQKRLQRFGHLQRMPGHLPQKQLLRWRLTRKKTRLEGTSLRCVDLVSRDLTGTTNWQKLVTRVHGELLSTSPVQQANPNLRQSRAIGSYPTPSTNTWTVWIQTSSYLWRRRRMATLLLGHPYKSGHWWVHQHLCVAQGHAHWSVPGLPVASSGGTQVGSHQDSDV